MHLSNSTLSVLVLLTLVLTILVVLVLVPAVLRGSRRRARAGLPSGRKVAGLLEEQAKAVERLEGAVRKLALGERHLGELAQESIRRVGLVRFDAFEDMGGRLSFSAAFLDGHGDGVVITSINGRQDTRCYAKRVSGGSSPHNLSDEERQAIREALSRRDRGERDEVRSASERDEAEVDPMARAGFAQRERRREEEGGVPDVQAG
jgi:hypothetical protein